MTPNNHLFRMFPPTVLQPPMYPPNPNATCGTYRLQVCFSDKILLRQQTARFRWISVRFRPT